LFLIDGKKISAEIKQEIKDKTAALTAKYNKKPGLAVLLVGDDPASSVYVNSKEKACKDLGFNSIVLRKPADTSQEEVLSIVNAWNNVPEIHGILVQLPLPKHIDEHKVIMAINPDKDVDGFHPESVGRLVIGLPGFVSCTPAGVFEMLRRSSISLKGKHVVVLGRSNIVGKPIANLLYQKTPDANAIVTIAHTGAKDITEYSRMADVLIVAIGVPEMIKAEHIKEGCVIIDVGINRIDDPSLEKGYRLTGDVDFNGVKDKVSAISPVPGGVGLMTIAMLMNNTLISAMNHLGEK
jgi:methylenetetrahydrofolate dehydrogenase (NADP+) / methenyltetrahydrofolate cyclohydrolase